MRHENQSSISKARRARERDEMNARIKDIAREMFVREGYEAVTLQKIAVALEYTPPAIYRYFKDKKTLLATLVLEDMAELHAQLLECAEIQAPLTQLREMARRTAAWAAAHPNHYLLFYSRAWTEIEDATRAAQGVLPHQEPLFILRTAVEQLKKEGLLKEAFSDVSLVARTLLAALHGVIMLEITMSGYDKSLIQENERPILQCLDTMIDSLTKGLIKAAPQASGE